MQSNRTTARFALAYDGESVNDGTMDSQHLAHAVLAMGELVDLVNRTINGDRALASLNVRAIHPGSVELQFALDVVFNVDLQMAVNVALTAGDIKRVLFGGSALGGAGGVFMLFKRFRGDLPRVVSEIDDQIVGVGHDEDGTPNLAYRIAVGLYELPQIRTIVGRIVQPLVDLDLERLVVRDSKDKLEEVTTEEAYQWRIEELEDRELENLEIIREELRTGFTEITSRIESDMVTWAFMGRTITEINGRLDSIEKQLIDKPQS